MSASAALAAGLITASRLTGGLLDQLGDEITPASELDAYDVQAIAHPLLEAAGFGRRSGWKIGCTTKVMQAYLGIDSPCAGGMFLASTWRGRHAFTVPQSGRLGVECEIAVRIGQDLPDRGRPYEAADMTGAVAASMAAIEVVQDRYADYPSLGTTTLIADDFFHYACVLGAEVESFRPDALRDVAGSMVINSRDVGNGVGTDILGDPLRVLGWLANNCAGRGSPLQAGDVVLLGSLVQTQWVQAGDVVTVTNDPLGEVAAEFIAARPAS